MQRLSQVEFKQDQIDWQDRWQQLLTLIGEYRVGHEEKPYARALTRAGAGAGRPASRLDQTSAAHSAAAAEA